MRKLILVVGILFLGMSQSVFARTAAEVLENARQGILVLDDNAKAGIITHKQAEAGIERYRLQVAAASGKVLSTEEILLSVPDTKHQELTMLQKISGLMDGVNMMAVIGLGLITISILWIFRRLIGDLLKLFTLIPKVAYEILLYALSGVLLWYGTTFSSEVAPFIGLGACCLFVVAVVITAEKGWPRHRTRWISLVTLMLTNAAIMYSSPMIAFGAVIAAMVLLGFSGAIDPFCIAIGFKDKEALGKSTVAAFVMLTFFVTIRISGESVPVSISIFERGALFLGAFVGYLGLLISSSRWSARDKYAWFQIITILGGVLAIFVGSIWNIPELSRIGGTFFVIYLLEKLFDFPFSDWKGYAYISLLIGALLYGGSLLIKSNPLFFGQFLLF